MAEPVGPLIDNLNRAERFGWIDDAQGWIAAQRLRNNLVHEYVEDPATLAEALNSAYRAVDMLCEAYRRMRAVAEAHNIVPPLA